MASDVECIYRAESPVCAQRFDPTVGEGDHVIPSALGEFSGDKRFRGACQSCNNLFGQNEQQIVQSGLEGYLRYHAKARSRRNSRRGLRPMRGAKGAPPPEHSVKIGDETIAVRPLVDSPEDVIPFDQLRITDSDGNELTFELNRNMTADHLRAKWARHGIEKPQRVFVNCDEENWDYYTSIVKDALGDGSLIELDPLEAGSHRIRGQAKFTVNTAYFQAIAKIAFHYYLVNGSRGLSGDEAIFVEIRQFICNGGDSDAHLLDHDRIQLPFGSEHGGASPANWCHLLLADESGPQLISRVQLFLGPGSVPRAHSVVLGQIKDCRKEPMVFGHLYEFDDDDEGGRSSGHVRSIPDDAFTLLTRESAESPQ